MSALEIDSTVNQPWQLAVPGSSAARRRLAQLAAQLRSLLPPAAHLAALMQQYYALPAVEAERQLALAQVAAGRSCAYLRCANLGGEGGPKAGQGVGSMRCRWAVGPVCGGSCVQLDTWKGEVACYSCLLPPMHSVLTPPLSIRSCQRLPRGVVLRHRLLARRLAGGRAPPHVQGSGRSAAGGQGGGCCSGGSGSRRAAVDGLYQSRLLTTAQIGLLAKFDGFLTAGYCVGLKIVARARQSASRQPAEEACIRR